MSKIGKKYNFFSNDALKTGEFYSYLLKLSTIGVTITNVTENYNETIKAYTGSIELTGPRQELENLLLTDEFFKNAIKPDEIKNSVVFSADMHYEELLELTVNKSSSYFDGLNLYKFKSPLEYNFLVKNYESFLSDNKNKNISETALPYFYDVLAEFVQKDNFKGFEGTSFYENPNKIIISSSRPELITNIIPSYVEVDDELVQIDKYLTKFDAFKEQFPFYADIKFSTHEKDENNISDALQEKNLYTDLLNISQDGAETQLFFNNETTTTLSSIKVKEANINDYLFNTLNAYANKDFTFIFDINSRIDNKARTFLEVLQNKQEYLEVVGYHLKKFDGTTNALIQEWYLPNVSESDYHWIDTQIKYNKLYTYKLDLIILSFSTEYAFKSTRLAQDRLFINFINKPLIKVYVLGTIINTSNVSLGASYTNKLLDYPPLEPEVEIIPFIGVSNQIKINLNTSTGMKTVPAITFSATEEADKAELKLAQNKNPTDTLVTFQADESNTSFEIYRLDFKPSSYADFFGNRLALLSTQNSSAGSFLDTIQQNKKYYYVARGIDFHNHVSNPTPLYEVEIINDSGLIIPVINIVDFDKQENLKQSNKSFKRYLKLQPALTHRLINAEKLASNKVQLGSEKETPWDKNFKIRITSKSTGKKIDINFAFKYNKPS
jgi:hypothetical protein